MISKTEEDGMLWQEDEVFEKLIEVDLNEH